MASYPWENWGSSGSNLLLLMCSDSDTRGLPILPVSFSVHFRTNFLNSRLTVSLGTCEAMLSFHSGSPLLFKNRGEGAAVPLLALEVGVLVWRFSSDRERSQVSHAFVSLTTSLTNWLALGDCFVRPRSRVIIGQRLQ
jgi:hypothetical protein